MTTRPGGRADRAGGPAPLSPSSGRSPVEDRSVVDRLRRAGCVFAEQEAAVLVRAIRAQQGASARPDAAAARASCLEALVRRREAGEPLEHLVGWVDFEGLRLAVGPGAFVPRQRSRHLARRALTVARRSAAPVVAEVCAGVAPIAAVVAHALPAAHVHAADCDPVPLVLAARNLPGTAHVHCGPLLEALPPELRGRLDVVAAVPPYVPQDALDLLPREAREHEPVAALAGGPDGLDHVRRLITQAARWLAPAGRLLVELHPTQVEPLARCAAPQGWRVRSWTSADGQTGVVSLRRDSGG